LNQEVNAILQIAMRAALCDGQQSAAERQAILQLTTGDWAELAAAQRAAEAGKPGLADLARSIVSSEGKRDAMAAALAVCNADGSCNATETAFLDSVRAALGLGAEAEALQSTATAVINVPVAAEAAAAAGKVGPDQASLDKAIRDAAVLNGALELLPDSLASLAILPLQLKLVHRIGKAHNYDLGREHIRDFVATLGVGMTAQYLEGFARKLLGSVFGGVGRQAASSGMAFVTTYAIGHAAKRYYAGGRKLETLQLRETYQSLLAEAKNLAGRAQDEIRQRAGGLSSRNLVDIVKSG
jgi:uncharacterized protein (DUF697 family)/tellurite resistance protein